MASTVKDHWNDIYAAKADDELGWFQPTPALSLELIGDTGIGKAAAILDIGGGASRLVGSLLDAGFGDLSVLDISERGLVNAQRRLGGKADAVAWIVADVTAWRPQRTYDLWHDRAVFHFLTEPAGRDAYITALDRALAPDGHAVIATFAPDGPEKCSGLPVVRYGPEDIASVFNGVLELRDYKVDTHRTPTGVPQNFLYFRFRRTGAQRLCKHDDTMNR